MPPHGPAVMHHMKDNSSLLQPGSYFVVLVSIPISSEKTHTLLRLGNTAKSLKTSLMEQTGFQQTPRLAKLVCEYEGKL